MALDSSVAFRQRALQCQISEDHVARLQDDGIRTFAQYAFCCTYSPGGSDEKPLLDRIEGAIGAKPSAAEVANFRRLFYESHALALNDLKTRLERTENAEAKSLPLAEKVDRIQQLKGRLTGLLITQALEPSHALIDKAVQQYEDNCLKFLDLSICTSREQEILSDKSSTQLSFDSSGNIKVSKRSQELECALNGEMKLRAAFQRRALAYDIAGIATYNQMEMWTTMLFDMLQRDPPNGYRHVSIDQIIRADKRLWLKVVESTRSQVTLKESGVRKVDLAIQTWMHHPEVQFHFLPLPAQSVRSDPKPKSDAKQEPQLKKQRLDFVKDFSPSFKKGSGKGKGKRGQFIEVPEGCSILFGDPGKPVCKQFNVGRCRANVKPGKRCAYGFHVCWRKGCNKPVSATECVHN